MLAQDDNKQPLRILVVDDTVVYRKIVSEILNELPNIEVVGAAHNGKIAMSKIASLKPDLITLDVEMPEMNGIEVLECMKTQAPEVGAIMVSTLTQKGGDMTMKALELGAFDFIPKPQDGKMEDNRIEIKNALVPILKAFNRRTEIRSILKGKLSPDQVDDSNKYKIPAPRVIPKKTVPSMVKASKSEIIGIGVSTGGPSALAQIMPKIPAKMGVPIMIVQHMPPLFTKSLAASLNSKCLLDVHEAQDGETIRPDTIYIAPGGKQMKIVAGADGLNRIIRITNDPPENSCKPSVDYLFRSMAYHYVGRATGVIMTGMGSDGTLGLKLMKRNGSTIIAQNESSCVVYGMPKIPIESGIADVIAPLDEIVDEICRTINYPLAA
jgi:two-component system chemotaxis response regulator CheB